MGSREDDAYWDTKYAEAECYVHGDTMYWEPDSGEWECYDCINEEDMSNG